MYNLSRVLLGATSGGWKLHYNNSTELNSSLLCFFPPVGVAKKFSYHWVSLYFKYSSVLKDVYPRPSSKVRWFWIRWIVNGFFTDVTKIRSKRCLFE